MSIIYTADVFCDGVDCSQWTHGVTASTPPKKSQAREAMRNGFRHINGKDYCPACVRNHYRDVLKGKQ